MELKKLSYNLTVCKINSTDEIDFNKEFFFIGKTDEELSLVCKTEDTPAGTKECENGWKGFRIQGVLDFSLIGILSKVSGILAEKRLEFLLCLLITRTIFSSKKKISKKPWMHWKKKVIRLYSLKKFGMNRLGIYEPAQVCLYMKLRLLIFLKKSGIVFFDTPIYGRASFSV